MNTLATLQQRFLQQVLQADIAAPGGPLAMHHGDVTGPMEIYIHAYQGRMRQALASNFEVLHKAMGDDAFGALARAFCSAQPSRHRSIRWLGEGLCDFLVAHPQQLPHPALLDIARMDWAMRAAFDAADAATLSLQDLGHVAASDWPTLRLQALPSVQLLELQWGVEGLWHSLHADPHAHTEEPLPTAHAMVIWRAQLECRWRTVDASELLALRQVQAHASFAELCEALQQTLTAQAAAHRAAELLRNWVSDGLLACTGPDT